MGEYAFHSAPPTKISPLLSGLAARSALSVMKVPAL